MKVKIDIISGFLGAGKTTFIKELVKEQYQNEKIVVIENEFGKVNFDGEALKSDGIIVHELSAGCICCNLSEDFAISIKKVIEVFKPERIIVEPSGVARMSDIIASCNNKCCSEIAQVNSVITIVDGSKFRFNMLLSKEFFENQIRTSNCIVISKLSSINEEELFYINQTILQINNSVNIFNLFSGAVDFKKIIELSKYKAKSSDKIKFIRGRFRKPMKSNKFEAFELEIGNPIDIAAIERIFDLISRKNEFGKILRGKGIFRDESEMAYKINYVSGDISINKNESNEKSRICLIGYDLNKKLLSKAFCMKD